MIRTSFSHPLEFGFVNALNGRIGMCSCPGIIEPDSASNSWQRDLDLDLNAIVRTGARAVVTLVEAHEMVKFRIPEERLQAACSLRELQWHWLPIRDMSAPDSRFTDRFNALEKTLTDRLEAGETIVIHCRAGLGRTGTVAALLLTRTGVPLSTAVDQVRRARPGAIETAEQEQWLFESATVATG